MRPLALHGIADDKITGLFYTSADVPFIRTIGVLLQNYTWPRYLAID